MRTSTPPVGRRDDRSETVLLIDPDELSRTGLAVALRSTGRRILETHSAEDALYVLSYRAVDLVIAAHHLAGMDGLSLAEALRSRAGPPVILIDDTSEPAVRAQHFDHGIADLVSRHDDPRIVAARSTALLRRTAQYPTAIAPGPPESGDDAPPPREPPCSSARAKNTTKPPGWRIRARRDRTDRLVSPLSPVTSSDDVAR